VRDRLRCEATSYDRVRSQSLPRPNITAQARLAIICGSSSPATDFARCRNCQGCFAAPGAKLRDRVQKSVGSRRLVSLS
jgi:hypothetical protein